MAHPDDAFIIERLKSIGAKRVLDYGCGGGELVEQMRAAGLEAFGADVFYGGSSAETKAASHIEAGWIVKMEDGTIPFEVQSFDAVVSYMVFEHIENYTKPLEEIRRVLALNGKFLCFFPSRGTFREGHCGVPFTHWFRNGSRGQYLWLRGFRALGFGPKPRTSDHAAWASVYTDWLRRYTFYRSYQSIVAEFSSAGFTIHHCERDLARYRLYRAGMKQAAALTRWPVIGAAAAEAYRRAGTLALICTRDPAIN